MSNVNMLSVCVLCFGIVGSSIILNMTYNSPTQNPTQAETVVPVEERSSYTVKLYGDRVGVFRGTADVPYTYLDVEVAYLSDYDVGLLTSGITVTTDAELKSLIEDLTS